MRFWIVWMLVLAGCYPAISRRKLHNDILERQKKATHARTLQKSIATPRPELDVTSWMPEPVHELRWPRSSNSHPVLDPEYNIADLLAQPGVTWMDLCKMGAQNRRLSTANQDPIEYLRAWCAVAKRDVDEAIRRLAPLGHSTIIGIPQAVRIDIANIVVDFGDADAAEKLLTKHHLPDTDLLDMVAATYVEIGKLDDAAQINARAIESNAFASAAIQCRRLHRSIVLGNTRGIRQLELMAAGTPKTPADETCAKLSHEISCWKRPETDCGPYMTDEGLDSRLAILVSVYHQWPKGNAFSSDWLSIVDLALLALPMEHADEFAVVALESAVRTGSCLDETAIDLRVRAITGEPKHSHVLDGRLEVVLRDAHALCTP